MLSLDELKRFNGGTLSDVFVRRIFQEYFTYPPDSFNPVSSGQGGETLNVETNRISHGEMDYKGFLDFYLAIENKRLEQGLAYFWQLFDIKKVGYLDKDTLNFFLREIIAEVVKINADVKIDDVIDEIFDMVSPEDPEKITFQDLMKSGCSQTVVTLLSDVKGFWIYENRENFVQSEIQSQNE